MQVLIACEKTGKVTACKVYDENCT